MAENISELQTLSENPGQVEELAMKSIGRDLEVEAVSWILRGPIKMVSVKIQEDLPILYFGLEWMAIKDKGGWKLDETNERDPVLGEVVAIARIDEIYLDQAQDGNDYLIAPTSGLFTVQIHPEADNLRRDDIKFPLL